MTQVSKVVIDFVRMTMRAFYPLHFVILVDAILKSNNYAREEEIITRVKLSQKEVRTHLVRMREYRLVKSEQRLYKKSRKPGFARSILGLFWFIDYLQLLDMFNYRLAHIRTDLSNKMSVELAHQLYKCTRCGHVYTALDVTALMDDETGAFVCDCELARRVFCKGVLIEEDTQGEVAKTNDFQRRLDEELRPLLELIEACKKTHIPKHPLDGADEETWKQFAVRDIDATVKPHGEEHQNMIKEYEMFGPSEQEVIVELASKEKKEAQAVDDGSIPEKPAWFQNKNSLDKDQPPGDDKDFAPTQPQNQNLKDTTQNDDYAKSYYEQYLQSQNNNHAADNDPQAAYQQDTRAKEDQDAALEPGTDGVDEEDFAFEPADEATTDAPQQPINPEEIMVQVGDRHVPLLQITEEVTNQMTPEEYQEYYEKLRQAGFIDDPDM